MRPTNGFEGSSGRRGQVREREEGPGGFEARGPDLTTLAAVNNSELLVIERLAADLEKAASVDEIKDILDRAAAIKLYARKKAGGLAAAQHAGRIVTSATLKLAELYRDEEPTPGQRTDRPLDTKQEVSKPGKKAVAKAAGMDPAALSRLRPVLEASAPVRAEAKAAIEARGEIVTPASLLREVTSASAAEDYDGDSSFTPPKIIEKVRAVLGSIDVDPATHPIAQKTVKAKVFYTKEDDGLSKKWHGNVFCNPPYSAGPKGVEGFAAKLIEEYKAERTKAAIFLVNNATDAGWFQDLLALGMPVCLTRGRLPFVNMKGEEFAARRGQAIFYLGPAKVEFYKNFLDIGTIVKK